MSKKAGISYEILTKEIFEEILRQEAVRSLEVRHNVLLKGKTANHQVDIYWAFEVGGIRYETIVQAKDWSRPVEQGELLKFRSVLDDIPGQPRGVFVTRTGYQRGAEQFARAQGILIYELFQEVQEPIQLSTSTLGFATMRLVPMQQPASHKHNNGDGEQRAGKWFWETVTFDTEIRAGEFKVDVDWLEDQRDHFGPHILAPLSATRLNERPSEIKFYDASGDPAGDLHALYKSAVSEMIEEGVFERHFTDTFQHPTFLRTESPSLSSVKVQAIESTLVIHEKDRKRWPVRFKNIVTFVLRNVVEAKLQLFEKDTRLLSYRSGRRGYEG